MNLEERFQEGTFYVQIILNLPIYIPMCVSAINRKSFFKNQNKKKFQVSEEMVLLTADICKLSND